MTYQNFLKNKLAAVPASGFDVDLAALNPHAFDWQRTVARWAIRRGCAALFEDCGLGKTLQELIYGSEVAALTGRPVLALAPLGVCAQIKREGEKFGIAVNLAESDADVRAGVNVTNYEKLAHFTAGRLGGIILDESSVLKAYMGKTKRLLVEEFKDVPFKLAGTATPAPNDLMELLNHAEFLGIMRSSEALAIWFTADQSQSGKYRLKTHATKDFWRWVASWGVCISKPSDIGFDDSGYILPLIEEQDIIIHVDETTDDWTKGMFREIDMSATGFHAEKRRTLKERCQKTAGLARMDEQVVIWTYQNDEADELKRLLPEAVEVRGSHSAERKERAALDFVDGKYRVLISKPTIYGYGLNLQCCHNVIFNGLDYSYESYYQAIRRFYRFGQKNTVNVWRVLGSTERGILDTISAKQRQKDEMQRGMAEAMRDFQTDAVRGRACKLSTQPQVISYPAWVKEIAV